MEYKIATYKVFDKTFGEIVFSNSQKVFDEDLGELDITHRIKLEKEVRYLNDMKMKSEYRNWETPEFSLKDCFTLGKYKVFDEDLGQKHGKLIELSGIIELILRARNKAYNSYGNEIKTKEYEYIVNRLSLYFNKKLSKLKQF